MGLRDSSNLTNLARFSALAGAPVLGSRGIAGEGGGGGLCWLYERRFPLTSATLPIEKSMSSTVPLNRVRTSASPHFAVRRAMTSETIRRAASSSGDRTWPMQAIEALN